MHITATYAPIYFATLYENTSIAICAFLSPAREASVRSRKSLESPPESPYTPESLFKIFITPSTSRSSLCAKNSIIAGSISPQRVPITSPSNGVSPMDVSTDLPFKTAVTLDPFPRWHTIVFVSSYAFPNNSAALLETKLWLVPWKP